MAKTYRFDPDEDYNSNGRSSFGQSKREAKRQAKFEKRRGDKRDIDDRVEEDSRN